jgi:hypothetical protein
MIYYSDLYLGEEEQVFSKRFWDFAYAQRVCQELEEAHKPFYLLLWNEDRHIFKVLRRFRVPSLQTSPH